MIILTVNVGSASVRLRVLEGQRVLTSADLSHHPGDEAPSALAARVRETVATWPPPQAVAHRFVHGGSDYVDPVFLDDSVLAGLRGIADLAPAHQPAALDIAAVLMRAEPLVPHVAIFDTAFHASLPATATTLAVPESWRTAWGVRRFGFHGLSVAHASQRALVLLGRHGARVVVAHLGSTCSVTATVGGRSVETSMGFTPLDGMPGATSTGSVDPTLATWLSEHHQLSPAEVVDSLANHSGLLALAGTGDMRRIIERCHGGPDEAAARLARDIFVHRLVLTIGAMTAAAGGLDALVFTGGIGESCCEVRVGATNRLRHLGVLVDPRRNYDADQDRNDTDVSWGNTGIRTYVVRAREDLTMAREAGRLLGWPAESIAAEPPSALGG